MKPFVFQLYFTHFDADGRQTLGGYYGVVEKFKISVGDIVDYCGKEFEVRHISKDGIVAIKKLSGAGSVTMAPISQLKAKSCFPLMLLMK